MAKFIYETKRVGNNVIIETTAEQDNEGHELHDFLVLMTRLDNFDGCSIESNEKGGTRYELRDAGTKEKTFILKNGGQLTIPLKF